MRRLLAPIRPLLAPILGFALMLGLAAPAFAANRVPSGVTRVSVTLTFAPTSGARKPESRTYTKAKTVASVVDATDALASVKVRGECPMIMRLGPNLTVVFRSSNGKELAEETVQVVAGTKGDSGSSDCFPIRFTSAGKGQSLLGNSFVRMMGRLLGTAIS
jgi:hypothetical protein